MVMIMYRNNVTHVSRDGGLKRARVKDSLKEEQQKMYSSMIAAPEGPSDLAATPPLLDAQD